MFNRGTPNSGRDPGEWTGRPTARRTPPAASGGSRSLGGPPRKSRAEVRVGPERRPGLGPGLGLAEGEDALSVIIGHVAIVGAVVDLDQAIRPGDLVGGLLQRPAAIPGPVGDLDHRG